MVVFISSAPVEYRMHHNLPFRRGKVVNSKVRSIDVGPERVFG